MYINKTLSPERKWNIFFSVPIFIDFYSLQNLSDTEELLKNEEVDPTTVARDSKGKKKKKYLGRIQYKV